MIVQAASRGQGGFDGGDEFGGIGWDVGSVAVDEGAVAGDEELLEVPEDGREREGWGKAFAGEVVVEVEAEVVVFGFMAGKRAGEEVVERVGVFAVDANLGEHGKGDGVVGGAEGGDLGVGAGLLAGKVVGGEAEDDEAAVPVGLVQGFKLGVLRGEAAPGGHVHDEDDFAGVGGEGGCIAGEGGERDFVKGRHERSSLASRH